MKLFRSPKTFLIPGNRPGGPVVMVPTMGALHRGHQVLIQKAKKLAGSKGTVVVSIFVNPIQFGPGEDLSKYPRPFSQDLQLCKKMGVDMVFAPSPRDMYAGDFSTQINETLLSNGLCGAARPGHFQGVCTVVAKLFNIVQPDIAVFGQKDFQQLAVICRMVRDLNIPVKIVSVPTVRERDGLALSSRNVYLNAEERAQAPMIHAALKEAGKRVKSGTRSASRIRQGILKHLYKSTLAKIDYIEIVDAETLQPVPQIKKNVLIAAAVFFGRTRLIDNLWIR